LPDSKIGAKLIPLGLAALALLADAPRLEGNSYVIPGRGLVGFGTHVSLRRRR
jgi:hypothetical protein